MEYLLDGVQRKVLTLKEVIHITSTLETNPQIITHYIWEQVRQVIITKTNTQVGLQTVGQENFKILTIVVPGNAPLILFTTIAVFIRTWVQQLQLLVGPELEIPQPLSLPILLRMPTIFRA